MKAISKLQMFLILLTAIIMQIKFSDAVLTEDSTFSKCQRNLAIMRACVCFGPDEPDAGASIRNKRGIVEECCDNACPISNWRLYCDDLPNVPLEKIDECIQNARWQ